MKLDIPDNIEIRLCLEPTDMRKSFDSLSRLVSDIVKADPFSGHLFIFTNKRHNMFKILFWDRTGFCLYYKRLENGKISLPSVPDKSSLCLDRRHLSLLLDGISFT